MNSMTAAERAGITYRQLDHWISRGYLNLTDGNPGSGIARTLTGAQVRVLENMAVLARAGVRPSEASALARRMARGRTVVLGGRWRLEPVEGEAR